MENAVLESHQAVQKILPELYQLHDLSELPPVLLEITTRLIPNLFCTYNELDLATGSIVAVYHTPSWRRPMEALMPRLAPFVHQHPIYRHVNATGDGRPMLISDCLSEKEWAHTEFARGLETVGVKENLIFCLQTSGRSLIFIALNRADRDFSERDRLVAELLRQHIIVAHDNAAAFTTARALSSLAVQAASPHALVLVDREGHLLHASAAALEMLGRHFPAKSSASWKTILPPALLAWLRQAPPGVFTQQTTNGHRLEVRAAETKDGLRALLLRENAHGEDEALAARWRATGLSRREAEVLHWTAEGKTNAEIGGILGISPRTVGKHLETIYEKLGVESRAAAMLWVHRGG